MPRLTPAELNDVLFDQFARLGRALASPHRIILLDMLSQGEKTVETLAQRANFTVKNTSAHLRALREARLVATRKEGTYVFYRVADPSVTRFLHDMLAFARTRLAEVDLVAREYFERPGEPAPISPGELHARLARGDVQVLDLRAADEYAAGHVPGAWSTPSRELETVLTNLPARLETVVYCRSAYCTHGVDALHALERRGITARRLAGGYAGWQAAALPVEAGPDGTALKVAAP